MWVAVDEATQHSDVVVRVRMSHLDIVLSCVASYTSYLCCIWGMG